MKKGVKHNLRYLVIILISILLLAFVDFIVLEKIYNPISAEFNIPWDSFTAVLFGIKLPMQWWHVAFFPLAFVLFILLGFAAKSWRLAISGIILFVTGLEDVFYYLIQLKFLPPTLDWLDPTIIGLTRFITRTPHVISLGVLISLTIGILASLIILFSYNPLKLIKK